MPPPRYNQYKNWTGRAGWGRYTQGMGTYGQYCPVARATEILADRWTLLIVREMLAGVHHFNDLERGLPGISRTLLVQRLRRLELVGVVKRRTDAEGRTIEYRLTQAGEDLQRVVDVVGNWGVQWAFGDPRPEELDPGLLLWRMRRRINLEKLPPRRVVVEFDFQGTRTGSYWLILDRGEASVCLQYPGFDIDLLVSADIADFYRIWLGYMSLAQAMRQGLVSIDGTPALVRSFPKWLALSPFAPAVRSASSPKLTTTTDTSP